MSLQEVDIEKAAGTDQETPADSNSTLDNNKRSGSGSTAPGDLVHQERRDKGPGRIQSMATSLASFWSHRTPTKELKVRSLNDFPMGYPNLATFQNSSENFTVYRRFGYLQSRLLLEKQDALRVLEARLDKYDRDNQETSYIRSLNAETIAPRQALLGEIEKTFSSYASILASSQSLQAANRPSESEYRSVRNYLDSTAPLHYREQEFIQYKEDLITLRPGRDHAWLDRRIERALQVLHRPFPWLNGIFSSPETRLKSRHGHEIYYTRSRIDLCASSILTATIAALLIVPIYLLYKLVEDNSSKQGNDGKLDAHTTAVCMGILLVCTLLFSGVLSLFTRAKRHEILGAAAAYCAVLVVFLGNVPN